MKIAARCFPLLAAALMSACATLPPDDPADPLESMNRAVFGFNRGADRYVLRPIARGYRYVMPGFAEKGVINFFNNLGEPITIVNGVLQGKFVQAGSDTGRFLLNSTFGIAGFVDVASKTGLPRHDEDFGQTLGYWGIGTGVYLMLPVLGPSNGRDFIGRVGDFYSTPLMYVEDNNPKLEGLFYGTTALNIVGLRAQLLGADSLLDSALDPYIFVRTAYLQNRLNKVYDGNPPRELIYGFDEEEDEEEVRVVDDNATAPLTN
jgi:phospholipid-binding lipoprotein MlaA